MQAYGHSLVCQQLPDGAASSFRYNVLCGLHDVLLQARRAGTCFLVPKRSNHRMSETSSWLRCGLETRSVAQGAMSPDIWQVPA
jgi:hypothetical protein